MRRVFVEPDRLTGTGVVLDGEAHRYLAKVLRLRAGDRLAVFDGRGTEVEATVTTVSPRTIELALGGRRMLAPAAVAVTLLQAVPRGDKMDLVVQKTTELGVGRIVPVLTARAVPRLEPDAADTRRTRWQAIAREACRQCGRADVPTIDAPAGLNAALADHALPTRRIMLWEGSQGQPMRQVLAAGDASVALLIGPEGGFEAAELALAEQRGFATAGLGPRILRAETAAIVAVALAQAAGGGLD